MQFVIANSPVYEDNNRALVHITSVLQKIHIALRCSKVSCCVVSLYYILENVDLKTKTKKLCIYNNVRDVIEIVFKTKQGIVLEWSHTFGISLTIFSALIIKYTLANYRNNGHTYTFVTFVQNFCVCHTLEYTSRFLLITLVVRGSGIVTKCT